ncbi:MAG TPA: PaaI family thioesterase [Gemmatimonadales bacterium]|nr:PaaI family thioesterase [Gemmatimonadales bacterium]
MTDTEHLRKLERMYVAAAISRWYGISITVGDGTAEVRLPVRSEFYHAANAVHGSVYFRALDDAAFFAANSRVREVLVLTVSFTIQFARPIMSGEMRAMGRVVHESGRLFMAESDLFDDAGKLLGRGSGVFTRSSIALDPSIGYA